MILEYLSIASLLAHAQASTQRGVAAPAQTAPRAVAIRVEPKDGSGLLVIKSPWLEGETFTFVTCEALIQDQKSSKLFPMTLGVKDWKQDGGRWSYTWEFEDKLRLDFSAAPEGESVLIRYVLTNGSSETAQRVAIFPCLPSLGAPSFYPGTDDEAKGDTSGRKARVGRHDYSELYGRLSLFSDGKRFTFKDSPLAADEKHLAFMKKDAAPLVWGWFVNGEKTFDVPLLVLSSRDDKFQVALTLDRGVQASSNVGDGRACVHIVPRFDEIPPGKSASSAGRIYWMRAQPEVVLERYREDFPGPAKD